MTPASPSYRDRSAFPTSPPYAWALGVGAGVFLLYALTVAPTTAFWDTSEYIATGHILGIPHPPGNPLFVLLARAWELLLAPFGLSVAVRINLFSALMSAGAAVFWFLVAHRILAAFTDQERIRRIGAAVAVLLSATAFTVWNQSNVNEKVYTVSLFTIALLSWLVFLWRDHVEAHRALGAKERPRKGWGDDNVLLLMVFILALSVGNHLMAFLAAPALLLLIVWTKPQVLGNWRLYAGAVLLGVLGLSVHLYLPIRGALDPIINEADPTCGSIGDALVSVVTFGRAGCEELSAALAREQYAKPPVTERQAPFWAQVATYAQYFDWQWARSLGGRTGYFAPARLPFTLLFLALGLWGAWTHWMRDRKSFAYMATLFGTLSVALVFYLNFKLGYMQTEALGIPWSSATAEVRERDYFFVVSFSLWGLWAGIGITVLWLKIMERLQHRPRPALLTSPVLALALIPLVLNWPYASRAGDYAARNFAYNLLQSVEPYGVLFTVGDNDSFPLWYLQEVEGIRKDVTLVVGTYLNTSWYPKQIRDLSRPCPTPNAWAEHPTRIVCQRPAEPETIPDLYANRPKPTDSILPVSDAEIEATAQSYVRLPQDVVFQTRGIRTLLPADTFLTPADQLTLAIIKHAWGDRPIHFSSVGRPGSLGLGPFVARHGLTYKLVSPEDAQDLLPMPQDEPFSWAYGSFLDVERTRKLLWEEFRYGDLLERPLWPDDSTRNIPGYYLGAQLALAQGEALLGNARAAELNLQRAQAWADLADR